MEAGLTWRQTTRGKAEAWPKTSAKLVYVSSVTAFPIYFIIFEFLMSCVVLTPRLIQRCSGLLPVNSFAERVLSLQSRKCVATRPHSTGSRFRVVEHVTRGQHTREYPRATSNGDSDKPVLAVKQYIPLNNPEPKPGDVTIIAAHANGFPKACVVLRESKRCISITTR